MQSTDHAPVAPATEVVDPGTPDLSKLPAETQQKLLRLYQEEQERKARDYHVTPECNVVRLKDGNLGMMVVIPINPKGTKTQKGEGKNFLLACTHGLKSGVDLGGLSGSDHKVNVSLTVTSPTFTIDPRPTA